jgi:hypothetical protein
MKGGSQAGVVLLIAAGITAVIVVVDLKNWQGLISFFNRSRHSLVIN